MITASPLYLSVVQHVKIVLNVQDMSVPLRLTLKGRHSLLVVCIYWATNTTWQNKLLDRRKVTQMNLLPQDSVKDLNMAASKILSADPFLRYSLMLLGR